MFDRYLAPVAEALYNSLIEREGNARVDLLDLTAEERRPFLESQWPQDPDRQANLIWQMYPDASRWLDVRAVVDPPECCDEQQVQHCRDILYHLYCSFVVAMDDYLDLRYRVRLERLPEGMSKYEADTEFFRRWRGMTKRDGFPPCPQIHLFPVVGAIARGRNKRVCLDLPAASVPNRPENHNNAANGDQGNAWTVHQ